MRGRVATCPCGLAARYPACCGRFHRGGSAPSAELLMRSRFSAFAVGDAGYLLRTWDVSTRPVSLVLDAAIVWKRLTVLSSSEVGSAGTVEFEARFVHGGVPGMLRENSSFRRVGGAWCYVAALD